MSFSSLARSILMHKPLSPCRPLWPHICLALLLVLAQTGSLLHALEHESTASDASCALCLGAQHLGDAVHKSQPVAARPLHTLSLVRSAIITLHVRPGVPFSARAPPFIPDPSS